MAAARGAPNMDSVTPRHGLAAGDAKSGVSRADAENGSIEIFRNVACAWQRMWSAAHWVDAVLDPGIIEMGGVRFQVVHCEHALMREVIRRDSVMRLQDGCTIQRIRADM